MPDSDTHRPTGRARKVWAAIVAAGAIATLVSGLKDGGDGLREWFGWGQPDPTPSATAPTPPPSPTTTAPVPTAPPTADSPPTSAEPTPSSASPTTTSAPPPPPPPSPWPQLVGEQSLKSGYANFDARTTGKNEEFGTCVSFGTNGFQGKKRVELFVPKGARTFKATLGLTKTSDTGDVTTQVLVDGSPVAGYVVAYDTSKQIEVPVSGSSLLTLTVVIGSGGTQVPSNKVVVYGNARFDD